MRHLTLTLAALALAIPALAEDPPPRRARARGETIHIQGERQIPYAFGVTGRSPLGYAALDDARTFTPEVTRAVRCDPF